MRLIYYFRASTSHLNILFIACVLILVGSTAKAQSLRLQPYRQGPMSSMRFL